MKALFHKWLLLFVVLAYRHRHRRIGIHPDRGIKETLYERVQYQQTSGRNTLKHLINGRCKDFFGIIAENIQSFGAEKSDV